jgi:hypothetical protein
LGSLNPSGYPTDLLLPTALFESASSPTTYTPITEATYFPIGYTAAAVIGYWSWQEEKLYTAPCSANRSVIIQYRRQITIPVLTTDLIGMLFGELYLGAKTAAIAAGASGNIPVAQEMAALAEKNFEMVITANRGQQKPGIRP